MNMSFNHRLGNAIDAIHVGPDCAIGAMSLAWGKNVGVYRPTAILTDQAARAIAGADGERLARLRRMMQRRFDKKRRVRAKRYADYLLDVRAGKQPGGNPPITLYCKESLITSPTGEIMIPLNAQIVPIDGETQLEARFINADREPDTANDLVPFVIWHGISIERASQIFYDLNHYATPVSPREAAPTNVSGAVTRSVLEGVRLAGVSQEAINRVSTSLRKKTHITTFDRLLAAAAGFIHPKEAITHGGIGRVMSALNKPDAVIPEDATSELIARLLRMAVADASIASAPDGVWAAVGARSSNHPVTAQEFANALGAYQTGKPRTLSAYNAIKAVRA